MARHPQRVIRGYSLPVAQFDWLKAYARTLQRAADAAADSPAKEGDPHWISNSAALAKIVQQHCHMSMAAEAVGLSSEAYASALHRGELKLTREGASA